MCEATTTSLFWRWAPGEKVNKQRNKFRSLSIRVWLLTVDLFLRQYWHDNAGLSASRQLPKPAKTLLGNRDATLVRRRLCPDTQSYFCQELPLISRIRSQSITQACLRLMISIKLFAACWSERDKRQQSDSPLNKESQQRSYLSNQIKTWSSTHLKCINNSHLTRDGILEIVCTHKTCINYNYKKAKASGRTNMNECLIWRAKKGCKSGCETSAAGCWFSPDTKYIPTIIIISRTPSRFIHDNLSSFRVKCLMSTFIVCSQ